MGGDLNPGPATTQEPQVPFGHPTGSGVTPLPLILDLTCAQSLRDTLVSLWG